MTEEIIVDGVNVAGCEYLCTNQMGNNCLNHNQGFSMNCKNNNNCYYKQLKRLEQERDELKRACEKCKLFDIEKTNRDLLEQIEKLEQENKELKEFCVELERQKQKQHMQWFTRCTENHNEDSKIIEKYRSALEEIRKLAETGAEQEDCYSCDEILGKIDEVMG